MKRIIGIMMAMVMSFSVIKMPIVKAEVETGGFVMADFYSKDNEYANIEVDYILMIEDDGEVSFYVQFDHDKMGYFEFPKIMIKDTNNLLYNEYNNSLSPRTTYRSYDGYFYNYESSIHSSPSEIVYIDSYGKTFYRNGDEKIYFTDTIIVEFNGITITKEIGNGNSETQIIDNNPVYGDFNFDGEVNAADAVIILQYAAERGAGSFTGTFEEYVA